MNILIADDHEMVRDGLRALIEAQPGWQVVGEAANGREAVALALRLQPHIVILDFTMPELNGLEATRQIRNRAPEIEVLVLTMHESERLARLLLAAGARGYILKSDAKSHLIKALEALSQHASFFTPMVAGLVDQSSRVDTEINPPQPLSLDSLTGREREVLQLVAEGRTTKEIADLLQISGKTVEVHRTNLMGKLRVHSIAQLVRFAIRNRIIEA